MHLPRCDCGNHPAGRPAPLEPRLITFDFGDTLVTSEPSYLARTAMMLTELGYPRTLEDVTEAYLWADIETAVELIPKAPFEPEQFRQVFGRSFFEGMGLSQEAPEVGPRLLAKLVGMRPKRVMMPGARELLEALHDLGYPCAIISNNDGYTRDKCRDVGIEDYFQFILDSTQEGIMKPDPRIFHQALGRMGLTPPQVLHVGDLFGCDVMGAAALGINAVWLGNDIVNPPIVPGARKIMNLLELLDHLAK